MKNKTVMEFQVIPNKQTPAVPKVGFSDGKLFVEHHKEEFEAFLEYAKTYDNAVGLAANQCSIDGERFMARVFALRDLVTREWRLVLDPYIKEYIGMVETKAEGCLTWKGQVIVAERSRGVMVSYFDEEGKPHHELHKGFEGQIWQHEINHLNGVEEEVRDVFIEPKPIEVGRNEECPCGSGKKYKKCCLLLI
jgi:peptide deformylase